MGVYQFFLLHILIYNHKLYYMIENNIDINGRFLLRVNFNLVAKKSAKAQIWLTTTINRQRVRLYTGQRIEPEYWIKTDRNQVGERAIEDGNISALQKRINREVNKELKKILGYCHEYGVAVSQENLMQEGMEFSKETFEAFITAKLKGKEALIRRNPLDFIQDYIERKKNMVNKNTKRTLCGGTVYNHKNALKRLQQFCTDKHIGLVWEIFDRKLEDKFTAWMNAQGYSANTIATQYSIMKVWLSEAEMDGLIKDPSFHKYTTKTHDVSNIYLTEDEIQRIYEIDFTSDEVKAQIDPKSNIEQTRDLFVLACWTGLRFGDWHNLSAASINENKMSIVTHKTNKTVVIPLHPFVKSIIKKYNEKLPKSVDKSRVIEQIRMCGKLAGIDDEVTLNRIRGGKTLILQQPKYSFMSTHTARRSFATNMYLKKTPVISLMAITGHTTEANFMKYIKVDNNKHAELVGSYF